MKKLLLSFLICMLAVIGMQAAEETATLSFADKAQRTSFSTIQQVWEQNGITFTNDKASSSNNVADYANPVRFYANSSLTVECANGNMTKIVFDCNNSSYATALKNSIGTTANVAVSSDKVTVTLDGTSNSFTVKKLTAQVRMDALTVTYVAGEEPEEPEEPETPEPVVVPVPTFAPADGTTFEESLDVTIKVEGGLTAYYTTVENGEYTPGNSLTVFATTTVWAKAVDEDGNDSEVVKATYTLIPAGEQVEATISFASTAQRISQDNSKQVWSNAGITFTNKKTTSSSNVADYSNPVRLYKNSEVIVDCALGKIIKIVFDCNETKYATALQESIGATATASSDKVTVILDGTSNSFTVAGLSDQVRLDALSVTYVLDENAVDVPEPTFTPGHGSDFIGNLNVTIEATEGDVYYSFEEDGVYTKYEEPINIATDTTIYAKAIIGDDESYIVSATYKKVGLKQPTVEVGGVNKVEDVSTLAVGDKIVIVAADSNKALSTTQNTNNRGATDVTKDGNTLVDISEDVQIITLEAGTVEGTWAFNVGDNGYLYAASGSNNYLKTQKTNNANGSWKVTIGDGVASIIAQGANTRNVMQYNPSSSLFSCYGSATQQSISIYEVKEALLFDENIEYGMYYLSPGKLDTMAKWYAAHFVNANTGKSTWVYGLRKESQDPVGYVGVYYGLQDQENGYTHVAFCAMMGDAPVFDNASGELDDVDETVERMTWDNVYAYTDYVLYVPAETAGCISVYDYDKKDWAEVDPQIATGVERVEATQGIGYAYGVVLADGAIEVYNVNGVVVARGNDTIDLRGLGRGVYIVRNGNTVRKVVR